MSVICVFHVDFCLNVVVQSSMLILPIYVVKMIVSYSFIHSLMLISTKRLCWYFSVFIVGFFHGHLLSCLYCWLCRRSFYISIWVLFTMDMGAASKSLIICWWKKYLSALIVLVSFHFVHRYYSCINNINLIHECWLVF